MGTSFTVSNIINSQFWVKNHQHACTPVSDSDPTANTLLLHYNKSGYMRACHSDNVWHGCSVQTDRSAHGNVLKRTTQNLHIWTLRAFQYFLWLLVFPPMQSLCIYIPGPIYYICSGGSIQYGVDPIPLPKMQARLVLAVSVRGHARKLVMCSRHASPLVHTDNNILN